MGMVPGQSCALSRKMKFAFFKIQSFPDFSKKSSFFLSLAIPFIIASFVTAMFYQLFFHYAPRIWSLNIILPQSEYHPLIRINLLERNGIQVYVLYLLLHLIIATAFCVYYFLSKVSSAFFKPIVLFLFFIASLLFYKNIGCHPPMAEYSRPLFRDLPGVLFIFLNLGITGILSFLNNKAHLLTILLAILLFPICMMASAPYGTEDYNFILLPAVRILNGFHFNQTGFQYDHLLSLLAVLWIKSGFSIYTFNLLGQIFVYIFFIGLYLFARRYFSHSYYALYLVISAVLVRIYGNLGDIVYSFQVTPLRLDWWFVVLLAVFYKKPHHWLVGLTLGFLLLVHHAFGMIYTMAYMLFILILLVEDILGSGDSLAGVLRCYGVLYARNVFFIAVAFVPYKLFFAFREHSALFYQQYGVGFLPISRQSFYWYIPIVLILIFILLYRNKSFLSERHFKAGLFLILLTIGNSLYFLGRSHENNIINISSILLFCLFFLFDLLHGEIERNFSSKFSKYALFFLAFALIFGISYAYSGTGSKRIMAQNYVFQSHFAYDRELKPFFQNNTEFFKKVTHADPKVTFASSNDAYYYYEGGYVPQNPLCLADARMIVVVKNLKNFFNAQLEKGYYLIMPTIPLREWQHFGEILMTLPARNRKFYPEALIISNKEIG